MLDYRPLPRSQTYFREKKNKLQKLILIPQTYVEPYNVLHIVLSGASFSYYLLNDAGPIWGTMSQPASWACDPCH